MSPPVPGRAPTTVPMVEVCRPSGRCRRTLDQLGMMPVIFWLAAIEAGKKSGFWATIFGGAAQLIMGNAVPGLVLGILIGKGVEESGWNHVTKVMMAAIVLLFVLSGFFRGFDMKMIESFHLTVPNWLDMIHNSLSGK